MCLRFSAFVCFCNNYCDCDWKRIMLKKSFLCGLCIYNACFVKIMIWFYFNKNHDMICLVKTIIVVDVVYKMTKNNINKFILCSMKK